MEFIVPLPVFKYHPVYICRVPFCDLPEHGYIFLCKDRKTFSQSPKFYIYSEFQNINDLL